MKRICSFCVTLLMSLSGIWNRCLGRARCEEAVQYQEPPHVEREDKRPAILIDTPDLKVAPPAPPVPFVPDDGGAVYEPLFARRVRTPWLMESVVASIMWVGAEEGMPLTVPADEFTSSPLQNRLEQEENKL